MTIGEALKEEQNRLGLTEEEMVQGIISKSAYSRVINNKRNISSESLVKILFQNNIDIDDFFSRIENAYLSKTGKLEKKLSLEMAEAVNNHNVKNAQICYKKIIESNVSSILKKRATLAYAFLNNKLDQIDDDFKRSIIVDLNKNENWIFNVNALRLFSSAIIVLPRENVEAEINFLFRKLNKTSQISDSMIERYASICDNYLHWKYDQCVKNNERIEKSENVENALNYLKKLKSSAHNLMYILSFQYYSALFSNNVKRAIEIRRKLNDVGCTLVIKNWPV